MYHYIRDKVFLKDMKYLCSNIINQLVQLINNDSLNHPSFNVYVETVNQVFNKYFD